MKHQIYDRDKLINSKKEINKMINFLKRKKYFNKSDNIYKIIDDDDACIVLFDIAIQKGFKPNKKFMIK